MSNAYNPKSDQLRKAEVVACHTGRGRTREVSGHALRLWYRPPGVFVDQAQVTHFGPDDKEAAVDAKRAAERSAYLGFAIGDEVVEVAGDRSGTVVALTKCGSSPTLLVQEQGVYGRHMLHPLTVHKV